MKQRLFLLLFFSLLVSCKSKTKQATPQPDKSQIEVVEKNVPDVHNARNSLDVQGIYKGTLPTASGSGMEVTITLSDSTYQETVFYIGKSVTPDTTSGKYTWNNAGNTITLLGDEAPNQYRVEENRLVHLDVEGNKITGDMADQYILKKQ